MNDNILKIRTLIDRFFNGETTLDEEQQLYDFFRNASQLPEDLMTLREMFLDLAAVELRSAPSVADKQGHRRWLHLSAAAAVVLLIVVAAATIFTHRAETEEEYVAYIYGERTTDRMVVLDEMQKTMSALAATDGSDIVEEQLKAMFSH